MQEKQHVQHTTNQILYLHSPVYIDKITFNESTNLPKYIYQTVFK